VDHLIASDGVRLHLTVDPLTRGTPSAGTVVIVHGLGEHSGRYGHVVKALKDVGWSVVTYDHRGHGRSEGKRGGLPRADAMLEDLARIIDVAIAETTPQRLVLLGHSMGGLIVARFVAEALSPRPAAWSRPVDAVILSSPALALQLGLIDRIQLAVFSLVAPQLSVPNGVSAAKISHDPQVVDAYANDPLRHGRVTPRLVKFMIEGGVHVRGLASQWRVPTSLLWAGDDHLVDSKGSAEFAAASSRSVVFAREFPGLYHEIFNEAQPARGQVFTVLRERLAAIAEARL
jgi:alpha-beta hydrolase superfamily lysophospholipase